jgi:site-specific DNA recombinase
MKQLFAYIRVSTPKQGRGVSLKEQRSAIEAYASRNGVAIIVWFVDIKTAAKAGRPEFARMVGLLRKARAEGVVIHKVDRSTRNFRDWADIDELIDGGIDVHFASDSMDLRSRGGRLAADIQVVVAVDYIRNLREEALKGIHGRLKQGILPHHAPIGYVDEGAGKAKTIDPIRGRIIRRLFQLYATGAYTLRELTAEGVTLGLRNRNGNGLRLTQIHCMLRNLFYAGVIRSARFGLFDGAHEPLVTRALFDRVQAVLAGKFIRRTKGHGHLFRRLLHCRTCRRSLVASARKGFVYYRCATMECPTTSVRGDVVDLEIRGVLQTIGLNEAEAAEIDRQIVASEHEAAAVGIARQASLTEALNAANARLRRLTDLLLDGKIDSVAHDERRTELILERQKIEQELAAIGDSEGKLVDRAKRVVELAKNAVSLYEIADGDEKRRLLEIVMLDCVVSGKTLEFSLREPFATIAGRSDQQTCRPYWDTARTFRENRTFLAELLRLCATLPRNVAEALRDALPSKEIQPAA